MNDCKGQGGCRAAGQASNEPSKHACKGMNECKGQGGCKTDQHECMGQNDCKGKGGCRTG
jgi:hypothetical protein